MFVADVCSLESDAGGIDRQHLVDDLDERQVGDVRSVPGTPTGVHTHLSRVDSAQGVVECVDADLDERSVVVERRFRVDLVEVLREGRIVDLDGQSCLGDGEVFFAQHIGPRPDEFLIGLVVLVGDAGGRTGRQCVDVACALVVARGSQTGLEVRDITVDLVLADVADRAGGLRELRLSTGIGARVGIGVDVREEIAVATVRETREHDVARRRTVRRDLPQIEVVELETTGAGERVVPPGTIVEIGSHGVTIFAVIG